MPSMSTEIHTLEGSRFGTVRDGRRSFATVPTAGLEPALPCGNRLLKTAPKPIRLRRRRRRLYGPDAAGMSLEVALPDAVLALETRHAGIAVQQRKQAKPVELAVPQGHELVAFARGCLDAEPSGRAGMWFKLCPKPLQVSSARRVEAQHDPFVPIVGIRLLRRSVREVRDAAVAIHQPTGTLQDQVVRYVQRAEGEALSWRDPDGQQPAAETDVAELSAVQHTACPCPFGRDLVGLAKTAKEDLDELAVGAGERDVP